MKLRLKYQLIGYYSIVIALVISAFLVYILQQGKDFSIKHLKDELIAYNEEVYNAYINGIPLEEVANPDSLRYTIIDTFYNILHSNGKGDPSYSGTQSSRDEIIEATLSGEGTALRFSSFANKEYLYYAKKYPGLYVRTSVPYTYEKIEYSHPNYRYQYAILLLIISLLVTLAYISKKLTTPLKAFNSFIDIVQSNKKDFSQISFPNNEYGEVGQKIVNTYKQLEQVKQFKEQVTHNIAHELKTPLTGVRAYLETILNDEEMSVEQMRKFIERAHKQTLRLTSLVNDVSVLNKLDEESDYYKIEEINISECLKEIEDELAHKLKKNNTKFRPLISSELSIRSSHDIIYPLFKNLMDNTLEHAGPDTTITIRAGISQISGADNYYINFTYSDDGKGIPDEALERLFDRFYRIEEGRGRKTGGSGLGLAIVKSSVMFHKGTISVENNPTGGVTFKFSLMSL